VRVSAEVSTACAWRTDGPVWCWGTPTGIVSEERLAERRLSPTRIDGLYAVAQVDVGDGGGESFACALESEGSVRCWGDNRAWQLGNDASTHSESPQVVAGLSDTVEIVSASNHNCARSSTGEVRCWGMGRRCELGQGSCGRYADETAGQRCIGKKRSRSCNPTSRGGPATSARTSRRGTASAARRSTRMAAVLGCNPELGGRSCDYTSCVPLSLLSFLSNVPSGR
jgi:hypothetical protein